MTPFTTTTTIILNLGASHCNYDDDLSRKTCEDRYSRYTTDGPFDFRANDSTDRLTDPGTATLDDGSFCYFDNDDDDDDNDESFWAWRPRCADDRNHIDNDAEASQGQAADRRPRRQQLVWQQVERADVAASGARPWRRLGRTGGTEPRRRRGVDCKGPRVGRAGGIEYFFKSMMASCLRLSAERQDAYQKHMLSCMRKLRKQQRDQDERDRERVENAGKRFDRDSIRSGRR